MKFEEIKAFLDEKASEFNNPNFIESDPIRIPHRFEIKEDIEISAFLVATIAWGNRKMIIRSGENLLNIMGSSPLDFVMNYSEEQFERISDFKHRTFNPLDLNFFLLSLKNIYENYGGLELAFNFKSSDSDTFNPIENFRSKFLETLHLKRSEKHISSPAKGSAAKRLNMFLRWMVRKDNNGVDFGIWKTANPSQLVCPLDVHSGNVARKLGLLQRKQNDWKAATELNNRLKEFDPKDPVKYDFALFGLGIFENF